jgi:hypothetical protein
MVDPIVRIAALLSSAIPCPCFQTDSLVVSSSQSSMTQISVGILLRIQIQLTFLEAGNNFQNLEQNFWIARTLNGTHTYHCRNT